MNAEIDYIEFEDRIKRADEVKELLNNKYLQQAFEDVNKSIILSWQNTSSGNKEERETAWLAAKLLNQVKQSLENHIQTGEMAKFALKEMGIAEKMMNLFK
jgi:hypothetical protein